jgi:hypothetical protein
MKDVTKKSIGLLIDDLITTSQKMFWMQELHNDPDASEAELAKAFKDIQTLNARRNAVINHLDRVLDPEAFTPSIKTYE